MAKKAYIGVDGIARKIKKGYIGVETQVPIYGTTTEQVALNVTNIAKIFDVTDGTSYTWTKSDVSGGGLKLVPANIGVNSSTGTITLKAKMSLTNVVVSGAYYTESNYDKITLKTAGTTRLNAVSGSSAATQRWSGSLSEGQTIELTYTKDSSGHASGEANTYFQITCNAVSVSVQTITGYETKSLARKIKKAYIGVGGVARPFWGGGEVTYYGTTTTGIQAGTSTLAATSIGDYALFGGGSYAYVSAYNSSLTRTKATNLVAQRSGLRATSTSKHAIFGYGWNSAVGDAYDASLTRTTLTLSSTVARYDGAATTIGDYAIFAGGRNNGATPYDTAYAYNTSLTLSTITALSSPMYGLSATTIGNHALFGAGHGSKTNSSDYVTTITAYDSSLTKTSPANLNTCTPYGSATSNGKHALFMGGNGYSGASSAIDAYDASLTHTLPATLSEGRSNHASTVIGSNVIVGCGLVSRRYSAALGTMRYTFSSAVDIYDQALTRKSGAAMKATRFDYAAATVGNYALFGGGQDDVNVYSYVDAYTIV